MKPHKQKRDALILGIRSLHPTGRPYPEMWLTPYRAVRGASVGASRHKTGSVLTFQMKPLRSAPRPSRAKRFIDHHGTATAPVKAGQCRLISFVSQSKVGLAA